MANKNSTSGFYIDDKYTEKSAFTKTIMPSDDIPVSEKKGNWCKSWAEAIYARFLFGMTFTNASKVQKYELLRQYGAGDQPINIYKDWLLGNEQENPERAAYYNINWNIFSPWPAFKSKVMGRMETQDHKVVVNAIDKSSAIEKEDLKWQAYFELEYNSFMQELQLMGIDVPRSGYIASSIEELEAFDKLGGFKLKQEIGLEKAIEYTEYVSDFGEIKKKIINDFIDIGCSAFRDFTDVDGVVKYKYIDFSRLVVDYSRETGFKDSRFWGYLEYLTINQVRSMAPWVSEEFLYAAARKYSDLLGNPAWMWGNDFVMDGTYSYFDKASNAYVYDTYRVPILICEWLSNDIYYKEERINKRGQKIYAESDKRKIINTDKKKTKTVSVPNVYTCHWIVGTDIVFNDGQQYDIPRVGEKRTPRLSVHAYTLPGKSMTERVVGNIDQVQLAYLKMQNEVAKGVGSGIAIEVGSLKNIDLGDGDMKPIEIIKLYRQTGDYVYKATTTAGKYNNPYGDAIKPIANGIGPFLDELVKIMEINIQYMSEASGVDRVSAVAQKPGEVSATEVKLSVAATSDSIQPMYSAYIYLKEQGAINAVQRILIQSKYSKEGYNIYYPILGKSTVELLKISREYIDRIYGLKVEALPNQEMKSMLIQAATAAMQPGKDGEKLSYGDYLLIVDLIDKGQLKQAQMILNFRHEKARQESLKLQRENMQLNAQNAQQQEMIKGQNAIAKLSAERDKEIQVEAAKAVFDLMKTGDTAIKSMQTELIMSFIQPLIMEQQAKIKAQMDAQMQTPQSQPAVEQVGANQEGYEQEENDQEIETEENTQNAE